MYKKLEPRIGFLVWNRFQFIQIQNIINRMPEAALIIWIKNELSLKTFSSFSEENLNIRYVSTSNFQSLDTDFDMIVAQNRQPRGIDFKFTTYVMLQYSLAKDLTVYNVRWDLCDYGLVYGSYSAEKLLERCTVFKVGNSRFDDYFNGDLDLEILSFIRDKLDPEKKTIAYLPTWGDLASGKMFEQIEWRLRDEYNIIEKAHHLSDTGVEINGEYTNFDNHFSRLIDDSLYILASTDVVLSDYSGVIFDALYIGKPVVLFRDKNIENNQHDKVSLDSIEISKSDLIGPVVYSPDNVFREIENQLFECHKYGKHNAKLVEECFEYKGNSATKVIESFKKILDKDFENEKLNVEKRHSIQSDYHIVAKGSLWKSSLLSIKLAKRAVFEALQKILGAICRTLDRSPLQRQFQKKVLSLEEGSLSEKRLFADILIEELFKRQCYEEIVNVYKKQKVNNVLFSTNLIKSLVITNERTYLGFELEKYLSETSLERSKFFHVYETAMASLDYPNETRIRIRNERVIDLRVGKGGQEVWQRILIANGYLWKIEELEIQGLLENRTLERIEKLKEFQGDLLPYSKIAGLNNCTTLAEKTIVKGGRHFDYNKLDGQSVVELNIPVSFFFVQSDENTKSVRGHLIEFYMHLIEDFIENEIPFMPILQFGWNVSPLGKDNCVISHHTRGGGDGHFHIKTSAVKGFVSFDSDGFAGWSSVAEENSLFREIIDGISERVSEDTWKNVFSDVVVKNESKYSQPVLGNGGYTFRYIFLPLQIAGDLVASLSYITGYDLASFLVDKFRGSEYKVVIKRHPLCTSDDTRELLEKLCKEDHVVMSNSSIHELIENASLVVTVNSGVGMESILHLKNVVITGKADYFYGATLVKTIEEFEKYLDSNDWKKNNDVKLRKFIHYYFNNFLVNASSRENVSARLRGVGL